MLTFALDYELWRLDHDDVTLTFVKKTRSVKAMVAAEGLPLPAEELTVEERDTYYGWRTVETHSFAIADLAGVRVKWTDGCTDIDVGEFGVPCTLVEISVKPTRSATIRIIHCGLSGMRRSCCHSWRRWEGRFGDLLTKK